MSREELEIKRRQLHLVRLKLAKYGLNAPVEVTTEEEDLAKDVRAIERELGMPPTPTLQERRAQPAPRYVEPVEPEPVFQQRMVGRETDDKRADIEHQRNLLSIHRRHLHHLRAQLRELGAYAPPYVRSEVGSRMDDIARIKGVLRGIGQAVDDLPGDE